MKVKAKTRGEWPTNVWHEDGDVFEYDGPTKKGGKEYFPKWMTRVTTTIKQHPSTDD